jgi:hypothetical protein
MVRESFSEEAVIELRTPEDEEAVSWGKCIKSQRHQ